MRSLISQLILTVTLLSSLSGCNIMQPADLPVLAEGDAPPAAEQGVRLDVQQLPSYGDVETELSQFKLAAATRPLTAAECACQAASRSELAAVLEKEAANTRRELERHRRHGPSELLPGILMDRAEHERNEAAKQALVAYYQLAEVHLQTAVLAESYQELDNAQQTVRGLMEAGIPVESDPSELDRRRVELHRQNAELDVSAARLTANVKTLIDEDPFTPDAIETTCSIEPRGVGYDLSEAMEIARTNDFQLKSINKLLRHGTTEDLGVARSLMQTASPLLGQVPVPLGFLAKVRLVLVHGDGDEDEMRTRKQQLRKLQQVRQKQLDLEVANGVVTVQQRFLEVGVANDVFVSWENRVNSLASQRELQRSNYQDLVDAKAERLRAKSTLLHALILLEIEHVKLRATMGLLVRECATEVQSGGQMPWASTYGPCRVLAPQLRQ